MQAKSVRVGLTRDEQKIVDTIFFIAKEKIHGNTASANMFQFWILNEKLLIYLCDTKIVAKPNNCKQASPQKLHPLQVSPSFLQRPKDLGHLNFYLISCSMCNFSQLQQAAEYHDADTIFLV